VDGAPFVARPALGRKEESTMKATLVGLAVAFISLAVYAGGPPDQSVTIANTPLPVTVQDQPVKVSSAAEALKLGIEFKTLSLLRGALTGPTTVCPR
jgi:hypothetical protein